MIDLNKSLEFFDPSTVKGTVHIIGCGAVGSQVAVLLTRLGITKFKLWDEDTVASHNIANQNFNYADIGRLKTEATKEKMLAINPECDIALGGFVTPYNVLELQGTIIFAVDSIAVRRQITGCLATAPINFTLCDFRMGLTSGQCYVLDKSQVMVYYNTMNFTDEEADARTPKSACNFELSVCYSIWALLGAGVAQLVKKWSGADVPMSMMVDVGDMGIITF